MVSNGGGGARRSRVVAGSALLAAMAVVAAGCSGGGHGSGGSDGSGVPAAAVYMAKIGPLTAVTPPSGVVADARRVLAELPEPPGGKAIRSVAASTDLNQPQSYPATSHLVDVYRLWSTASSADLITWYRARLPRGASISGSGSGGGGGTPTVDSLDIDVPDSGANISSAQIEVDVEPAGARQLVRADAQLIWLSPRPADETVPSSWTTVVVTAVGPPPSARSVSREVGDVATVGLFRRAVNGLALAVPGASDTALQDGAYVRLEFLPRPGAAPGLVVQESSGNETYVSVRAGERVLPDLTDPDTVLVTDVLRALGLPSTFLQEEQAGP